MTSKNCRQILHDWIEQNPDGWKIRTVRTIAEETRLDDQEVKDYFEIVMAEREGGVPNDYLGCIASEIRKLLKEHVSEKEVAFRTGATMEDVKAIYDEIDAPRRRAESMRGWTEVRR